LALIQLPLRYFEDGIYEPDRNDILCLRSVLMKPEHGQWLDEILARLEAAAAD
jgi:hypothetical protein